jgi:hypothetical protein
MHRACPLVKRLSLKTAQLAEQESYASMSACINWTTLMIILGVAFGLLGLAPLVQAFVRWRASRDCRKVLSPSLAEPPQRARLAIGEASSTAGAKEHRGAVPRRFSGRSYIGG